MIRAGVAGVGNLGKLHASTLLSMPDTVSLDALADPIEERRLGTNLRTEGLNLGLGADEQSVAGDVRAYTDYTELCEDAELDMIVLGTPSDLHAPGAIAAMEHGKHVFTEKPMALNTADCRRMIDASKANDRLLMVGQVLRFYPAYVAAHELMQSGKYGKPVAAVMNRFGRRPGGWFAQPERSGGVNLDLHIHDIDAALWWWGKPDAVATRTAGSLPAATSVLSQWEYRDGPVVQLEAAWDAGSRFYASFRLTLERATLVDGGGLKLLTGEGVEDIPLSDIGGHKAELIYFVDCVVNDRPVDRCRPEDSALSVAYALGAAPSD